MTFWDSSALMPLLVRGKDTDRRELQYSDDPAVLAWFGTLAEIESALARLKREGSLPEEIEARARDRLNQITQRWTEVAPTDDVRARGIRLLRVHPLRAGDAFQLAAALVFCRDRPEHLAFLTADTRLRAAAQAEGFLVG